MMNFLASGIMITGFIIIVLILVHKSSGGGVSDLFGGGFTSTVASSSVSSKNLSRVTYAFMAVWVLLIITYHVVL